MDLSQNEHIINSQIGHLYDTPEYRQLISSYYAPSIAPLINHQKEIYQNFHHHKETYQEDTEKWSILSSNNCANNKNGQFLDIDNIEHTYESVLQDALNDIENRIENLINNNNNQ